MPSPKSILLICICMAVTAGAVGCASPAKTAGPPPTKPHGAAACPDTSAGETPEDCPWAYVARELEQASDVSVPALRAQLEAKIPSLAVQFKKDRARPEWIKLWGESGNTDELAHGVIVQPALLNGLLDATGAPAAAAADGHPVHAGIEHTYGYLFSLLRTPYGYKRARWAKPTLDRAFGFTNPTLSPDPTQSSLFGNATYFLGRIAFEHEEAPLALLRKYKKSVPFALRAFDYAKLRVQRLEEQVGQITLRTDFVAFPNRIADEPNSYLLIYSARTSGQSTLVTAFPVSETFVKQALDPVNLGAGKPIQTRYNAYVEGLTDRAGLTGTRKIR